MRNIGYLLIAVSLSGCLLKSKLVNELGPVDQALSVIETIDCSGLQFGSDPFIKCELAKVSASQARGVLKELGVVPVQ